MFDRKQSLPVPVRFETTKQLNGFSSAGTKASRGFSPAAPSEMYSQIIVWIAPCAMEESGCDVSVYFSVMSAHGRESCQHRERKGFRGL